MLCVGALSVYGGLFEDLRHRPIKYLGRMFANGTVQSQVESYFKNGTSYLLV